jgi:DNA-3-methyladenine glycosylase II
VKAAKSIEERFLALYPGALPLPEQILATDHDTLRSVGLSNAKANYVKDLAQHIVDGKLELGKLDALSNDEIITELTAVKGIGEWTAHMFLMFCMGRSDVLPVGDLGIRNGVRKVYKLDDVPTPAQVSEIATANNWHPYESIASWYIWRSLDNVPN